MTEPCVKSLKLVQYFVYCTIVRILHMNLWVKILTKPRLYRKHKDTKIAFLNKVDKPLALVFPGLFFYNTNTEGIFLSRD